LGNKFEGNDLIWQANISILICLSWNKIKHW